MKCEICHSLTDGNICTTCGYDRTLNYESFGSLTDIRADIKSKAARQREWEQIRNRYLRCTACGGAVLMFEEATLSHCCASCGKRVASPGITAMQEKLKRYEDEVRRYAERQPEAEEVKLHAAGDLISANKSESPKMAAPQSSQEEKRLVFISGGKKHSVGLFSDGTVFAVGSDGYGQCKTSAWKDVRSVLALDNHTIALCNNGKVLATGYNWYGQCNVSGFSNVVALAGSNALTVALHADGRVSAVGANTFGQRDVNGWRNIKAVAVGSCHTLGLRTDGTVASAGKGACIDTKHWRGIVAIDAGQYHSVGLDYTGQVWAVGANDVGQCSVQAWRNVKSIAAGASHTVGFLKNGTVLAVGDNSDGRCDVHMWKDVVSVSAGSTYTIGIQTDGTILIAGFLPEERRLREYWDKIDLSACRLSPMPEMSHTPVQNVPGVMPVKKWWQLW